MTWLRGRTLTHERARAWISERMDAPLEGLREAALEAHLAACPDCRNVENEYRANAAALRRLASPVPPRDLPARTLAAIEFEARRVRPPRAAPVLQLRDARRSGGMAFGSLLTVALVAVVGVLLAGPVVQIPGPDAGATPFAIAPVDLAFVGTQGNVVRLYHTRLDRACPAGNVSCAQFGPQVDQVVELPRAGAVSALAIDPAGRRAAIAARSSIGTSTTYYVFELDGTLPPGAGAPGGPGASDLTSTTAPASGSSSTRPDRTARPTGSARPKGTAGSAVVATSPRPSASPRSPKPSTPAATSTASAGHDGATATKPSPTPGRASARPSTERTSSPVAPGATGAGAGGRALDSAASASAAASGLIVPGRGASSSPGLTSLPAVQPQTILQEVIPTGSSAAWSPDGRTLAFSAMPADGSAGSDIYTWHPGDPLALPITTDHASTFASWAGDRIVGSSLVPEPADPAVAIPQSFVLDPATGERLPITGSSLWLPSVDPTGRYVVGWTGTVDVAGTLPVPGQGRLVFASWNTFDPFGNPAVSPAAGPTGSYAPAASPLEPSVAASSSPTSSVSASREASSSAATSTDASPAPTPASTPPVQSPSSSTFAWSAAVPQPIDPSPQPSGLADWTVGWATDGSAFAVWESTTVGADTGMLSLHAVDQTSSGIDGRTLLMGPVAAGRAFSIGLGRLAWSTPPDSRGMSQLRVLVWGAFGRGELHSAELQQQAIFPAF